MNDNQSKLLYKHQNPRIRYIDRLDFSWTIEAEHSLLYTYSERRKIGDMREKESWPDILFTWRVSPSYGETNMYRTQDTPNESETKRIALHCMLTCHTDAKTKNERTGKETANHG